MFMLYAIAIGMALGLLLGGRISRIADVPFVWGPLVIAGFLAQIVLFTDAVAERVGDAGSILYVGSTMMVDIVLIRNIRIAGLPLVAVGAVSNLAAIVANNGYMPASSGAMAILGKQAPTVYSNSTVIAHPALEPLTDQFALPPWLPMANVFSLGDVLIGIGMVVAIVAAMRASQPRRPPDGIDPPVSSAAGAHTTAGPAASG